MTDISKLDENFKIQTSYGRSDIDFYNVLEEPMTVYGVIHENGQFLRMPSAVSEKVSNGVFELSRHTSGGRVCFKTDSDFIAIDALTCGIYILPTMGMLGSSGFDVYVRENGKQSYCGAFMPSVKKEPHIQNIINFPDRKMREVIVNFPLYCGVRELSIGVLQGSRMEKWSGYSRSVPMVLYGSSITQGGCANAPGTCYASLLSKRFDIDYINLGFSGNGKGEKAIFEYIADLDMSLFIYDYDYNAPTPEHLKETHFAGYEIVRKKHPDVPIIMASRPNFGSPTGNSLERRNIIAESFERAKALGDKNVYFADGQKHFADLYADGGTVDGCHPNDYGFRIMAKVFGDIMEEIFNK